jgi:hypothetical protein
MLKTNSLLSKLYKISKVLRAEDNLVGDSTEDTSTSDETSTDMPVPIHMGMMDIPWYLSRGFM